MSDSEEGSEKQQRKEQDQLKAKLHQEQMQLAEWQRQLQQQQSVIQQQVQKGQLILPGKQANPEEQARFVKGKGTREQILNVCQIIEKSREFNKPVVLCFVDYAKVFDCVSWEKLWKVLKEMGVPEHLISLIRNLYLDNGAYVKIDSRCSNVFKTRRGVRQGCILSPMLFNSYGEYIIRKTIEDWEGGFVVGGRKITNLRYADDTVLLATSMDEMEELLRKLVTESEELGLAVNKSKTKLIVINRANKLANINVIQDIDTVDGLIYLRSYIDKNGDSAPEIKRRINIARDAMARLVNIWNRGITIKTKIRFVRALVFPIFMYGVETWTIRERERQRIDAFEMWCWRRMLRVLWTAKRTNISILKEVGIKERLSVTCRKRILYFGHVVRRGDENLEKLVLTGSVESKRPRGRSPSRWADQIKEDGNLDDKIKDKFVTGLAKSKILNRICEEKHTATLQAILEVARKKEAALATSSKASTVDVHSLKQGKVLSRFRKEHFKEGHLPKICKNNKSAVSHTNYLESKSEVEDIKIVDMYNLSNSVVDEEPLMIRVEVKNQSMNMELDTGAGKSKDRLQLELDVKKAQ
ncbi:PREDICTED: uncharacterized protein LOC105448526 [Wasmannia auropunctata]|uniref:uncharacterized protein LOC105448526 n=1 Tax=Wasmannia auropunctata TaxID=64793 RepID=UPI0005EE0F5D|nr:PREDICTED: uncharacterized protein LOC105448526 [Wasmannia auropunctata]